MQQATMRSDKDLWRRIKSICKTCKYLFCFLLPLFLLPLAITSEKESRCLYALVLMAAYWILEPVHMAATALLPVVLLPLLGLLSSVEVGSSYMSDGIMIFIGGFTVAIAIESCNLHERVALKVLLLIGTRIQRLLFGLMITTMFFSMWVSNTATTAMMVPIVEAIVAEMSSATDEDGPVREVIKSDSDFSTEIRESHGRGIVEKRSGVSTNAASLKKVLLLSVSYSSSLGGSGSLTGAPRNLILLNLLIATYPDSDDITFASWMAYNIPGVLLCGLIAWIYLCLVYLRDKRRDAKEENIRKVIQRRYESLGKFSFEESVMTILFLLLVALLIFRKPKFISGWEDVLGNTVRLGDSVVAIGVPFLLFLIPKNPRNLSAGPILEWKKAQAEIPWGIFLLVGSGVTLAKGAKKSGLSSVMVQSMSSLKTMNPMAITALLCFITATVTEILTNSTTANILLPLVNEMAISSKLNPLYLMLPVIIASSYAFMLPIATPSNAIVYERGQMKILDMAKPGFAMNLICCSVQVFMINFLGVALFNLNEFPEWAMEAYNATFMNNRTYVGRTM